jgi:ABC-2 type transport system ATP-binding protein
MRSPSHCVHFTKVQEQMPNSIEVRNLTKIYRSHVKQEGLAGSLKSFFKREYKERRAVDGISFEIAQGELVGMLGANGAGKTTTLKMLSGLLQPTSGEAHVMGFTPWKRENEFKRRFAIVMGQRNQLWWDLPAADAFLLNKEIYRIPEADYRKRLGELAERLTITDKLHVQVRRLSLGERMKCELIGSLLHAPRVLFLDEPTIGLDVNAQKSVRDFLKEYNRDSETTIILTSHYMSDIEELCERVMVIDNGTMMFDGALRGLVAKYVDEKIVTVVFRHSVARADLERFGTIAEWQAERVQFRAPRAEIATIATSILNSYDVADLTIEEVPIEEVIRKIL